MFSEYISPLCLSNHIYINIYRQLTLCTLNSTTCTYFLTPLSYQNLVTFEGGGGAFNTV